MSAPKVSFNPSRDSTPWRVYFRGKSYWFKTEVDAKKKQGDLSLGKGQLTVREVDDYLYCRKLLQGVPLIQAVRFFNEHNSAALLNRSKTVAEMVELFKARLRGRPKYVQEGKRNLNILVRYCGTKMIGEVSPHTIESFLATIASEWSRDALLKWTRTFFKWCLSPLVKARADNPCDAFGLLNPRGTKVFLSLADTEHLLKICREETPTILHAVGLQLFAGIRTEEIIRMEWRSIRKGSIRIEPEVGKMGQVKGKSVARIIDWWPAALQATMPAELPTKGRVAKWYRMLKSRLLARCRETKPDFRWGQNAFRHSFGTYGLAFQQSSERICALMGERDVDTLHNHYAEYETQENGQKFFSLGSPTLEALPFSNAAIKALQNLLQQAAGGGLVAPANPQVQAA
jgi:integrase